MLEQLKKAAEHINRIEGSRAASAQKVRAAPQLPKDSLEPSFILPLNKAKVEGKISAVDGGILAYEMHGADLLIAKAVSSTFNYTDGAVGAHTYHPRAFPHPSYDVETGLDEREILWHTSLFRLQLEIQNALETAKAENPNYLLLDGSICPLISDRPAEESLLFPRYLTLLNTYKELYTYCTENSVILVGAIKDSRSKRLMDMLRPQVSERASDTVFLHHLLNEGERTFAFRYSESPQKHHVLRELGRWGEKICACYIKPVSGDRPMRIEFINGQKPFQEIADFISTISSINRSYAYPAILIDADLRAMMDPQELERAKKSLSLFAGPNLLDLRRNSRPFR